MTQKQKELLLKDLCTRLPYGVVIQEKCVEHDETFLPNTNVDRLVNIDVCDRTLMTNGGSFYHVDEVKPYLFPLSSMTDEQKKEYNCWKHVVPVCRYEYGDVVEEDELFDSPASFEYLIENHFDYYSLIPMGLAKDATGLNIY